MNVESTLDKNTEELNEKKSEVEAIKKEILAHCSARLPKYALPREMEFRTELPKTLVGKVAYTQLEKEEEDDSVLGYLTAEEVFKRFKYCYEHKTSTYKKENNDD